MENISTFEFLVGLTLLAPLISFLFSLLISDRYSWVVSISALFFLLVSTCASIYLFILLPSREIITIPLEWFTINQYSFNGNIELNRLSILMLPLVTGISFLVHLYSIGYMAGDSGVKRYFAMLGFFTFAMLGIVLSDNLLLIFVFWELVGFSSYMLIGHWMQKPEAAKASQKAFIFNRIGDAGFLVGIMIVWTHTQTLNLSELLILPETNSWHTAASLFIFCGVIGKSAQLPLFTWLPDAMEGPTPVSALIHAATMVAAGVFLLARVFPLFTQDALNVVAIVGIITSVLAALCALNQFDIKKILAYSTISQLGLMVTAVGVGSENAAMLHLFSHAFFKACLFLGAGSIIHALHQSHQQNHKNFDVQDIRNLGGLRKKMPLTFLIFLIAGSSLAGVPFFSGFLTKDSIITSIWIWTGESFSWRWMILILILLVSFITTLYTFRMIWYIFLTEEKETNSTLTESPWVMRLPMLLLASASVWLIVSVNPIQVTGWTTGLLGELKHSTSITFLSMGVVFTGFIAGWFLYVKGTKAKTNSFIQHAFGVDTIYNIIIGQSVMKLAAISETSDRKWIDGFLHFSAYANVSFAHFVAWIDRIIIDGFVNVMAWLIGLIGSFTRSFQGGKIQFYIFWAVIGLIIFLFFLLI